MKAIFRAVGQTRWRSRAHTVWLRLCTVCLSVYLGYITYLAYSGLFANGFQTAVSLIVFCLISLLYGAALTWAAAALQSRAPVGKAREHVHPLVFLMALGMALAVFGCAFAACYPGGVNYDISNQWHQAHSGQFNNWHPLFHTLLLWLATRAVDSYPFVLLLQIGVFSLVLSALTANLHRIGVPAWLALGVHALVVLSPLVRNPLMFVGKDSAMTIGVVVLADQTIRILYSRGEWLKKWPHAIALGTMLAFTTLLRHNAMLWTYVLLACVMFVWKCARRQALLSAGVMVLVLALVQGPLFGALDVVYPSNFAEESLGIPMTVLCDVRRTEPDKLDAEAAALMDQLADEDAWQNVYRLHEYNSIKFTFPREYIARRPVGELLSMTLKTAAAAPRTAFEAVNGVTGLVWDVTGRSAGHLAVRNSGDLPEANYTSPTLNALGSIPTAAFDWLMDLPVLSWLTQNIGVPFLLLLLTTLWALRRHGVAVLTLTLPVLIYNLGTMVLLAGKDARFFQCSMTLCFPLMLALLYLPKEEEKWN